MSENRPFQRRVRETIVKPYDKTRIDIGSMVQVVYGRAVKNIQWRNYHRLSIKNRDDGLGDLFIKMALSEEEDDETIACLSDRSETILEKTVISQTACVMRLGDLIAGETFEPLRELFEIVLLGHLIDHYELSKKLAHHEGLSPLSRTTFSSKKAARDLDPSFIWELRPSYRGSARIPARSMINLRLAWALEAHVNQENLMALEMSDDKHLLMQVRKAAGANQSNMSALEAILEPNESGYRSAMAWELTELASFKRAVDDTANSGIRPVFSDILERDRHHLILIDALLTDKEKVPLSQSEAEALIEPADTQDIIGVVTRKRGRVS